MRVIKHTQNAVILRIKAHYCALGRIVARKHFLGDFDIKFDEVFVETVKNYIEHLTLKYETLNRVKQYAHDGIWMPRRDAR